MGQSDLEILLDWRFAFGGHIGGSGSRIRRFRQSLADIRILRLPVGIRIMNDRWIDGLDSDSSGLGQSSDSLDEV